MVTAPQNSSTHSSGPRLPRQPESGETGGRESRSTISASERWLKISRSIYDRAQRRGFVGGDSLEDLSEAVQEIDSEYETDVRGLLSLTDPTELMDQFRSLFAGFGLGKRSLDRLLDINRDALEKLATSNRTMSNGKTERTARRASLLRGATDEAMQTLQGMAQRAVQLEERAHIPGHPTQSLTDLLSRLRTLANSAAELARNGTTGPDAGAGQSGRQVEIHGAVVKAYDGMTPAKLAEAPVAALKGVSQASGEKLRAAFGIVTIRDLASSRFPDQAAGIVTLADEEKRDQRDGGSEEDDSYSALAQAPVSRLEGISTRQAAVLREAFRIRTIRDLADNRFFRVARAIVTLADLKTTTNK